MSARPEIYDERFYAALSSGTRASAEVIVPLVLSLLDVSSVVDVGCGVGTWLSVFAANGVKDFEGLDGRHVSELALEIPSARFTPADLEKPLPICRRFDLALSLEVAEHLSTEVADLHVEELTKLAPVVLFSAAIPGQGGTNHINEQWPEYWAGRFAMHGYRPVDAIRSQIQRLGAVDFWYSQNTLMFIDEASLNQYPGIARWAAVTNASSLAWVHPTLYSAYRQEVARVQAEYQSLINKESSIRELVKRMPALFRRTARARIGRLFNEQAL